jgi:hypothetical protein
VHRAVAHTEALLDGLAYALERPQIGAEACRLRSGQQDFAQPVVLLCIEPRRTPAFAHVA